MASKRTDRHGTAGMYRPVDVDEGPDGAIYINDWSNHIIQHGEVDFHDKRRDHEHGRIWRLMPKDAKPLNYGKLHEKKASKWMEALSSQETYVRRSARRLLIEKAGPSILPKLIQEAGKMTEDKILLEYVWTAKGLGAEIPKESIQRLSESPDFMIRAAALRLGYLKSNAIDDAHPRVRLEAICALHRRGDLVSIENLVRGTDHETDRNIEFSLRIALRKLRSVWEGKTTFDNHPTRLARVVSLTGSQAPLDELLASLRDAKNDPGKRLSTLQALAAAGQVKHLDAVFDATLDDKLPPDAKLSLLAALADAKTKRKMMPNKDRSRISVLYEDSILGPSSIRLAAHWNLPGADTVAMKQLKANQNANLAHLRVYASTLAAFGKPGIQRLTSFASETYSPVAAMAALEAIAEEDPNSAAGLAPAFLASLPQTLDSSPLFANLLRSAEAPRILAGALAGKTLPKPTAITGIRAATTSGRDLSALVAALRKAGKLKPMTQNVSAEDTRRLIADVRKRGNPALGERIYRRQALACFACHAIGGVGPKVGPDLVSIGASAPIDYLIDSLIAPNKKIKEGFHLTVVKASGGKVAAGLELSADKHKVVLREASGSILEIPAKEILSKTISPTSLMPAGLTASLTQEEFIHLVSFLSQLGKEGPYRFPKQTFVRSVEIPLSQTTKKIKGANDFLTLPSEGTTKLQALVNGTLPLSEIPTSAGGNRYLRFRIQAEEDDEVRFTLSQEKGLRIQRTREKVKVSPQSKMVKHSVKPGTHLYILTVTPQFPDKDISLEFHTMSPKLRLLN